LKTKTVGLEGKSVKNGIWLKPLPKDTLSFSQGGDLSEQLKPDGVNLVSSADKRLDPMGA
jgi:hypothetical protein